MTAGRGGVRVRSEEPRARREPIRVARRRDRLTGNERDSVGVCVRGRTRAGVGPPMFHRAGGLDVIQRPVQEYRLRGRSGLRIGQRHGRLVGVGTTEDPTEASGGSAAHPADARREGGHARSARIGPSENCRCEPARCGRRAGVSWFRDGLSRVSGSGSARPRPTSARSKTEHPLLRVGSDGRTGRPAPTGFMYLAKEASAMASSLCADLPMALAGGRSRVARSLGASASAPRGRQLRSLNPLMSARTISIACRNYDKRYFALVDSESGLTWSHEPITKPDLNRVSCLTCSSRAYGMAD